MDSLLQRSMAIPSEKIDNFVYRNNKDLTFTEVNNEWGLNFNGFSNGTVYADLDNDGDLEIVINNIDDPAYIFENKASETANSVRFAFKGPAGNKSGLGTKVLLRQDGAIQFQELTLTRGFQSSVAPELHFGLGSADIIDSVEVHWPDGKYQLITSVGTNQLLMADYNNAVEKTDKESRGKEKLFATVLDTTLVVDHLHEENYYDDFSKEILLPHQTSTFGPNIAVADLNGDQKEDLVVGGAVGQATTIYLQERDGFVAFEVVDFEDDSGFEDLGIEIFDANNDGFNDIYVVSGGNEFEPGSDMLRDRLYLNNGKGNFSRSDNGLPDLRTSGSRVHAHDFDGDGDQDLLVCGRLVPGQYPSPADSYLLENRSENGVVKFMDVTGEQAPDLLKMGMATDALWTDFNGDGESDIIMVGEWMSIKILKNSNGKFEDVSNQYFDSDTSGWWFSIAEGDFDQDGDPDYIVGNLGLNYKYKASEEETFDIYFNDFDNSGTRDIVLSYFNGGKKYPLRGRECSSQQMPGIKKKFEDYASFSTATLEDVYTEQYLEESLHYQVKSFASIYLQNNGGSFEIKALPNLAQISSINQILVRDFDQDEHLDVVIAGNLHSSEVETPRNDAGNGLYLKGDGKGSFELIPNHISGIFASGDVKDMALIHIGQEYYILVAKNNDYLQFIRVNPEVKQDDLIAQLPQQQK